MNARAALGFALLLTLAIAARVSAGGIAALIGGALVWWLAAVPQPTRTKGRRLRNDLRGLLPVLAMVLAAILAFIELFQLSLSGTPGAGLAWFARALCLGALAVLYRTPAAGLVLHGLVIVLSLWTSSALAGEGKMAALDLALGIATIAACAYGLTQGRSEELRRGAEGSITTGVAPTPWGLRSHRAPALAVALLTLLPLALGVSLPRLPRSASEPGGVAASGPGGDASPAVTPSEVPTPTPTPSASPPAGPRQVEFIPQLDLDRGRGEVLRSDEVILRALARPAPPVLLLRGAGLARATTRGWFPSQWEIPPPPLNPSRRWIMDLQIEQLRRQHDALFGVGQPVRIDGVQARLHRGAIKTLGKVKYPLKYRVACRYDPGLDGDWPRAYRRSELIQLPSEILRDVRLVSLARRVAKGRTPHLKAQAVARWLRKTCTYDLTTHRSPGLGLRGMLNKFLHRTRRGVCEEFAMAMATMLRIVGVPTRVAIGYRASERDPGGRYVVRARDAHAWVEVAYRGSGWVTYDPTPPSVFSGDYEPPGSRRRVTQTVPVKPSTASPTPAAPTPEPSPSEEPDDATPSAPWTWPSWGTPLLAIALCVLVSLTFLVGRRRLLLDVRAAHLGRDAVAAEGLLPDRARLFALLAKEGFRLDGPETPLEFLARRRSVGPLPPELEEAVEVYTRLRFSGRPDPDGTSLLRRCLGLLGW